MGAIDILIIIVAVAGAVVGFARGIIAQVGQIVAIIGSIVLCRLFGGTVASIFGSPDDFGNVIIAYAIVFVAGYLLIWLVARMLRGVIHTARLGIADSLAGAVFKTVQWLLIVSLAMNLYAAVGGDKEITDAPGKPWRSAVADFAPSVLGYLSRFNNGEAENVDK